MEQAIEKAGVLIEALPYIQAFRDRIVVIKYGGSTIERNSADENILRDVVFMRTVGMRPIIVHGGGKNITKRLAAAGIETSFVKGLRVTDERSMEIVEDVILNDVNAKIVAKLGELGCEAEALSGKTGRMIRVRKMTGTDENGAVIDWGFVGEVRRVNPRPLFDVLIAGKVPVVAPLGVDEHGSVYNINADTVASEIASSLTAEKLVYLTDVPGILYDPKDERTVISTIHVEDVPKLKEQGVIAGGMIPKVDACVHALQNHVYKTHVISGFIPHSLLLEIFTDKGIGTEIVNG